MTPEEARDFFAAAIAESDTKKKTATAATPYRTFADVGLPVPEEEDPNVLFRNNWMGRGGGLIETSSTGAGKSSISVQQSFCWAVGEPFIGTPIRPIKTAIIQGEDMERDLQEQYSGMIRGFTELYGWDKEKLECAVANVHLWKCVGLTGDRFIEWLGNQAASDPVDNICINPLQSYFGGDISAQKDCDHFFREGIDPIIKGERGLPACMATIMAHTTKFASGNSKERATVDDYAEYIGAGSHAIADWARARVVFLKRANSEVYFDFKLAKRARCGWTDADGNRVSKKVFKHAEGYIFWQEVTDEDELAALDEEQKSSRTLTSNARKANDNGLESNAAWLADAVHGSLRSGVTISRANVASWARGRWQHGPADAAVKHLWNHPSAYGLKIEAGKITPLSPTDFPPPEDDF